MEVVDDPLRDPLDVLRTEARGIDGEEDLAGPGFDVLLELPRGDAAGQDGGRQVQHQREARTFPVAHGQGPHRLQDRGGVAGEVPLLVVAAFHGERLAAEAVRPQLAVGEERHGHVEHHVPPLPRDGEEERVIAHARGLGAPRRQIADRVGPADADAPRLRRLPAVRAGPHPVVGVAEGHAADHTAPGQLDRPGHREAGVQGARPPPAVPLLQGAEGPHQRRLGVYVHDAPADVVHEGGKPVQAVGVYPVAAGLGEEPRRGLRAGPREAQLLQDADELTQHFIEGDAHVYVWVLGRSRPRTNPNCPSTQ